LPWGAVKSRRYRWNGAAFVVEHEERNDGQVAAVSSDKPAPSTQPSQSLPPARPAVHSVVHAEPPGTDALIAAFRSMRGLDPSVRARFVTHANVAEDSAIESLLVLERELLVVGERFREGTGYFYFGLPVRESSDVLRVFTGDVNCDGRREIFVRVRQRIDDVQRELLFGYTFAGESLAPILATEVRRAQGDQSVGNLVSLSRSGRCFALRIEPGIAHGYTAASYPFVTESTDGYGRLLLPWMDQTAQYRFEGSSLALQ
jgi:hypothetical protein